MRKGEVMSADQRSRMVAGIKTAWTGERGEQRRESARLHVMSEQERERRRVANAAQRGRPRGGHVLVESACIDCGASFMVTTAPSGRRRRCKQCRTAYRTRVEKSIVCSGCGKTFVITGSRRYVDGRTSCSQGCASRKQKWPEERREEASRRITEQWADPEFKAETRKRISLAKKGQKPAPQTIAASLKSVRENGVSAATCEKHRQWWAGRGVRERMSEMHRQEYRDGRILYSGKRYPHLDRRGRLWNFRSTWEVKFAQYLDAHELTWDYEPHRLLLSDGRVYIPDFYVHDWKVYVEVKGWHGGRGANKSTVANADGHRVIMIGDITRGDGELHAALASSSQEE